MSTTLDPTTSSLAPERPRTRRGTGGRRSLRAAVVAAVLALLAAFGASLFQQPVRVTPEFEDGVTVVSDWGSPDLFGVVGSRILGYRHGTSVTFTVPWDGAPVAGARLGDGPVHLLTVTDVRRVADGLEVTVLRGNCRYFHERAIDMFPSVHLTLASGATTELLFDRPLFVKSPMLAACPDRTLNRQDDTRSSYRRGG